MKMFSISPLKNLLVFPFKEKNSWTKLLIGSALVFANFIIPIIPAFFVVGYAARIARRVIDGDGELSLPEWNDWGALFAEGFKISAVSLIYSLPAILVMIFGLGSYFLAFIALMVQSANEIVSPGIMVFYFFSLFLMMLSIALSMLFLFLQGLFSPGALMHMIHKMKFVSAFSIKEWWSLYRRNFSGFLLAFIIAFGIIQLLFLAIYLLYYTVILCFVLPFASCLISFYIVIVIFPLFAQAYKEGMPETVTKADTEPVI